MELIKHILKKNILYKYIYHLKIDRTQKKVLAEWNLAENPLPPPHEYKQRVIYEYAVRFNLKTFVETGTFLGFMIEIMKYRFEKIISIELDQELFDKATFKFSSEKNIEIVHGDSANMLPVVLQKLSEPALFWLDGHYSGGVTAKGELHTPIIEELESILKNSTRGHVILIDDARCFVDNSDYPSIDTLRALVKNSHSDLSFAVENDIIRIH